MKKLYLLGALALGLLSTGCSSDDLIKAEEENPVADVDQTLYVSMRISGDMPQGRAAYDPNASFNGTLNATNEDHFDGGDATENNVGNVYFVFYDDNGNVVGNVVEVDMSEFKKDETVTGATVASSYSSVVAVGVRKGEKKPSQVICYINPINSGTLNVSLNRIQSVEREQFSTGQGANKLFAMSNSVYYPNDQADTEPQIAVKFDPDTQLFDDSQKAKDALKEGNAVTIYVERYATKLAFQSVAPMAYSTATRVYGADAYTTPSVTLTFTPQYWAVNAQANRNYVIKSFRRESSDGVLLGNNYTFDELNKVINVGSDGTGLLDDNNDWNWNNPDCNRSYWGMSPAYFTKEYPEVSSDVMGDDALELNQTYISYNNLVNGQGFPAGTDTDKGTPQATQYFRETTVGSTALNGDNPAAAVASVILVGQYGVQINGSPVSGNPGFYTYLSGPVTGVTGDRPYVYFENNDNGTCKVPGGETMLKRFCAQATSLFKLIPPGAGESEGHYERLSIYNSADWNLLVGAVKVDEISEAVKLKYDPTSTEKLKVQANARTLQFKKITAESSVYILTGNGYKQIVADGTTTETNQITMTEANISLLRQVGMSYYYTTGHAYFNIPVKHLGWYRAGNGQKDKESIDWTKVRVGDFGMVRNHSYNVNVTEIKGLASGIGGDDVPIVPPATPTDYFMAYSVKILKWAVLPTQSVKL